MGIIRNLVAAILFLSPMIAFSQKAESQILGDSIPIRYQSAFMTLTDILEKNGSFKAAVYTVENTYYGKDMCNSETDKRITEIVRLCDLVARTKMASLENRRIDTTYFLNYAIGSVLKDTVFIMTDSAFLGHKPFRYSFNDPFGKHDWRTMFVTTLLSTKEGNCHSLSYLYKILADELKAACWLALAPNHIYIRNKDQKTGWYNTELSSGIFPTDAWIMTTGYVSPDAVRSGIYMDTLSNRQSIALCLLDLAKGYQIQTGNDEDGFILKCCDLVLQYHPVNPMALLLKAETLQKIYKKQISHKKPESANTYKEMEGAYITLAKLHYREMPEKMYLQWLHNLNAKPNTRINE